MVRDLRKADVESVLAEFDGKQEVLAAFCAKTRSLIEACLQDAGIRYQSVQARVKKKEKLREKYLDPSEDYRRLDDITDLAGLRVITYYEDEVDSVAKVIEREFRIDSKNSVDKRETEPDRFGYKAINYVCEHLRKRISDVEYKRFGGVKCEIQITSILGHAWSEIEHEWYDLRDAYPPSVKRRFSRIAALFDLAESEFLDIRKSRRDYERSVALRVEAGVANIPVDAVSLKSFIEQDPLMAELDSSIARLLGLELFAEDMPTSALELRSKATALAGISELEELQKTMQAYRDAILTYTERCREIWIIGRGAVIARGVSILILAMMLAAVHGEERGAEVMDQLGVSIGFNVNVPAQVEIARAAVRISEKSRRNPEHE